MCNPHKIRHSSTLGKRLSVPVETFKMKLMLYLHFHIKMHLAYNYNVYNLFRKFLMICLKRIAAVILSTADIIPCIKCIYKILNRQPFKKNKEVMLFFFFFKSKACLFFKLSKIYRMKMSISFWLLTSSTLKFYKSIKN